MAFLARASFLARGTLSPSSAEAPDGRYTEIESQNPQGDRYPASFLSNAGVSSGNDGDLSG